MDVTLSCSPDGERDDGVCVDSCISASGSTEDFFRLIRRLFLPLGLFIGCFAFEDSQRPVGVSGRKYLSPLKDFLALTSTNPIGSKQGIRFFILLKKILREGW